MIILIAEDNAISRVITQKSVERLNYKALVADNGLKAWEMYCKSQPDVVISDWMMPELDGVALCKRIREQPGPSYTYFILLTTLTERKDFMTGMQAGADDYLTKPLDRDQLQVRLFTAARITSLHRELSEQKEKLVRLNQELSQRLTVPLAGRPTP